MLQNVRKKYGKFWQLYVFLLIPIAYIFIFHYYPMVGIQIAFKKFSLLHGIWNSEWVGLYQFEKFFSSYQFQRVLRNTILLSSYAVIAAFPFPILFALALNVIEHQRYKKIAQTITYIPHFISIVVLVGIVNQVLHPMSGLYGAIVKFTTGKIPNDILASANAFPHIYVWSGIWQNFGYNSIIYVAALTNVSPELHEAAEIDGASRFQRTLHVDFPAILPTITIMLILRMGSVMSLGFQKIYLMQNTLNLSSSEVISTFVYKRGLGSGSGNDYSYASAVDLFNSIINLFMLICVNAIARRIGETSLW